jgi:hypothetical protein
VSRLSSGFRGIGRSRADDREIRDQPLVASWHPLTRLEDTEEVDQRRPRWEDLFRYGWRIYAVPMLVVVTALAVFQSIHVSPRNARTEQVQRPLFAEAPDLPSVAPGPPSDVRLFSADLPPGPPYPATGAGTYDVVPGAGPRIGSGQLYRYTVEIETGVQLAEGNDTFARLVHDTLSDPRSWTNPSGDGLALQRIDAGTPDFRVTLVSQNTARQVCGYSEGLPYDTSCRVGQRVYINAARWVRGAVAFGADLGTYRQYSINHEVGHVFGDLHVGCTRTGALAPVMMQQTLSLSDNELHELNSTVQQGGASIPADGAVCRPNAWPFPQGDGGR